MSTDLLVVVTVFVACAVEAVEALTIVLAVGIVRGWRSTLIGVAAASLVLLAVVAVLGPALRVIPISALRVVVTLASAGPTRTRAPARSAPRSTASPAE